MAELLSFNRHRPPILPLELPDGTVINLCPPTVDLQEEVRTNLSQLHKLLQGDEAEVESALYDLAARLMNCNRNLLKFTGQQLKEQYHMDVADLVVFYSAYADYIKEIESAKN